MIRNVEVLMYKKWKIPTWQRVVMGMDKQVRLIILLFIILIIPLPANASGFLSPKEQAYIASKGTIKVASVEGVAPLNFLDDQGEVQGISLLVLEQVGAMTGLDFEYKLYPTIEEVITSGAELIMGISKHYAPPGMILSQPFLKSDTIVYLNSSTDPAELSVKRFAAISGGYLPEGILETNAIYYDTREKALNAVERGEADYGYGNAYSIAYYMVKNDYKNIVTVPAGQEAREYAIGFSNPDDFLLISIINKAIANIDDCQLQSIIFSVAASIDKNVTFSMILDAYGVEIAFIVVSLFVVLLISLFFHRRLNNQLRARNKIHEVLSRISNEYFYEYDVRSNKLFFSDKFVDLLGCHANVKFAREKLKGRLAQKRNVGVFDLSLVVAGNRMGVFRAINSNIKDGESELIIGKLIDITEETFEKYELARKAQIDGLTGLYNAATIKKLITQRLTARPKASIDAFLVIDCDDFKQINDTYGHLVGDRLLKELAKTLKNVFRNTDLIGRMGGDEFIVYLKDLPSKDFVFTKIEQLHSSLKEIEDKVRPTVSVGVTIITEERDYETLFLKADRDLYRIKDKKKGQAT